MRRKGKYAVNDRVEYMAKGLPPEGHGWKYRHGYIKSVRRTFFGRIVYAINVARAESIDIVPERRIFGKLERRDKDNG